jgi:hypothetical protein
MYFVPLLQGSYTLVNYVANTEDWPEGTERGEFRAEFKMTLPSGDCLYGQETYWKIADKEETVSL